MEYSRIGWGKLEFDDSSPLFTDDYFFFNHSFGIYNETNTYLRARSGSSRYSAMLIEGKTVGVQFHPEKSQESGKKFLVWLEEEIWNLGD
jgi:imidazoleglycerol phosphate synthase glutamine amidotransferase subunit HisH